MHIELHRTFRELLRDETKGDDARALSRGNATLSFADLLNATRAVVLAEAGSGKTAEIREAARQLKRDGKAAFFLRLEHVVVDFDAAFEEGSLEEFNAWLASSEQGWVLLDSIDESRLRSPLDFQAAMRLISRKLATAKQRTHLLITGRAPAWRPVTDLELCAKLFPVPDVQIEESSLSTQSNSPAEHGRQHGSATSGNYKIVTLEDLSSEQVKTFAVAKGISNTHDFLNAIERADAWSFTARPQDLDELTGFWLDNGSVGTRLDLMKNSIKRRLTEPDQTRAEALSLSSDRALEGVQMIAAALLLTNQQIIQIPDGAKISQGLKLDTLLTDWADSEISTLLQRPLFAQDIYGAVRFHHRSVKEYLAAQWFLKLLSQEVSRRRVEELFFRDQYDLEVIVPSMRPLLPWIAMADHRILGRICAVAPEIVFEGGDPVQLPADVRSRILEQVCSQLANGTSTRSMADYAACQRFAAPDLAPTLQRLIRNYQDNDDITWFLMRMVWQGRLKDVLPEAVEVACSDTACVVARIAAFRAIADLGTPQDMEFVRESFAERVSNLDRRCMADLVSHIQQPDEQALRWLLDCIARLAEYREYSNTGLSEEIVSFFERAPIEILSLGIAGLSELLTSAPIRESSYSSISERYAWLVHPAGVAIRRLMLSRHASSLLPCSLKILHLLLADGPYHVRTFDLEKLELSKIVQEWPQLKWGVFWYVVEKLREMKAEKGERLTDVWWVLVKASYLTFYGEEFDDVVRALSERSIPDDKLLTLSLAFRIYDKSGRQRDRREQLKKAISGDAALTAFWLELKKPPKISAEIKQMERENARWSKRAEIQRARQEKAQLEAPAILEAQLETLRDPGFDDPSAISQSQHYLYKRMRSLDEGRKGGRWGSCNWRELEAEFGSKTPCAFRDGIVRYWRKHSPALASEGAVRNSIPLSDLFGLAGLTIEAAENPELFFNLRPTLAAVAFRYAMRELNGFPPWFSALASAHPNMVQAMMLIEVMFELQTEQENTPSHYIVSDLSRHGDLLWNALAPDIIRLLETQPPINSERLVHMVDILQASQLPDATIANLAAAKFKSLGTHLPIWAATWTGVDPNPAIDAIEEYALTLSDKIACTEFFMRYVTYLLGERGALSLQARTRFCSPPVLRRLYVLVHKHVRAGEDIERVGQGAYSPGLRDNAQEARERLVGILKDIRGRDAYLALKTISESHPDAKYRTWFVQQARLKAESDCERAPWSVEQAGQFAKEYERTPNNHRELFDLAVLRLLDLKHEMEDGDGSTASVLIEAKQETVVRNFIASWCIGRARGRYVIPQEDELPDAKRPDLRWHCSTFKGPVPTELKIADKWRGPKLFERLESQLAGDYLRDEASSRGIYLLINRGTQKNWQLPVGGMVNFDGLISALQAHWTSVASIHPQVEEIRVIGIDLTRRAKVPATRS